MVYNTVSSKEVITRILRKTKLTDTSYLEDIKVWLLEACNALKTNHSLELVAKGVTAHKFIIALPKDLSSVEALIYNGCRIRMSSSSVPLSLLPKLTDTQLTSFVTNTTEEKFNTIESLRGDYLTAVTSYNQEHSYKLQPGYIQSSFCEGNATLIYRRLPLDCDGFINIPDNTNYKQAIEWYIYQQMTFSGYRLPDARMDYSFCTQEFERFAARALCEITYPSVDKMESLYRSTTRLIPAQHHWENFGAGLEQIQEIQGL